MLPLTEKMPKCLLRMNNISILERLINQLAKYQIKDITVVIGYKKEQILKNLRNKNYYIKIIENKKFKEDMNILSLSLALQKDKKPFYLFEADCIFEDQCFELIFDPTFEKKSIWFSKGHFSESQYGGIIKSNKLNKVIDIKIVDKFEKKYKEYRKMIGILKVGDNEIEKYSDYLFKSCEVSIKQYYHMPWIEHINELKSYVSDFNNLKVISINTPEDFQKAKNIFEYEISKN